MHTFPLTQVLCTLLVSLFCPLTHTKCPQWATTTLLALTYALYVGVGGLLDDDEVVALAVHVLQVEAGAAALELPVADDGDAVTQDVSLVHVVRRQQDGASCVEQRNQFRFPWTNRDVSTSRLFLCTETPVVFPACPQPASNTWNPRSEHFNNLNIYCPHPRPIGEAQI